MEDRGRVRWANCDATQWPVRLERAQSVTAGARVRPNRFFSKQGLGLIGAATNTKR